MTELDRILSLRREDLTDALPPGLLRGGTLRPVQVAALLEWRRALLSTTAWGPPGLAVLAGCGHGKTLIGLLLPHVARAVLGRDLRTLYLVPASIREQWIQDADAWRSRGAGIAREVHVVSHAALSAPSGKDLLSREAPELIVIDEAHAFGEAESARWRRVAAYLQTHPNTRIVVMSGSLSTRSVRTARHLLLASLRAWCPLPADSSIDSWASVLDVGTDPSMDDHRALERVADLCPDGLVARARARAGYRKLIERTPGIVLTTDSDVGVSLRCVAWQPNTPTPSTITRSVEGLEARWELPDGTPLLFALEYARHAGTLPLGLYRRWIPSTVHPEWVEARRAWQREVNALVQYAGSVYQTPGAVEEFAREGKLDARRQRVYTTWVQAELSYPAPETEDVWDPYARAYLEGLVREYLGTGEGKCLLWTRSPSVGRVLADILGCEYHGADSRPPTGAPSAVVSIAVHGTGWDGAPSAGYRRALVVEPPSSGALWEQLLSRIHRQGATEDVETHVLTTFAWHYGALHRACADSQFVTETTGAKPRILSADWAGFRPVGRV